MLYIDSMEMRIREIPDDLHLKFKLMCTAKKISMNKYVQKLIKTEIEKYEQEQKKKNV